MDNDDLKFVESLFKKNEAWEGEIDWLEARERFINLKYSTPSTLTLTAEQHSRLLTLDDLF